ncbi:hypothetical protein XENTR_v10020880 [Xenopus tropicalis]|nr:hypothetical protein XENTR_v10020880 [Xenopus tropicalis]
MSRQRGHAILEIFLGTYFSSPNRPGKGPKMPQSRVLQGAAVFFFVCLVIPLHARTELYIFHTAHILAHVPLPPK